MVSTLLDNCIITWFQIVQGLPFLTKIQTDSTPFPDNPALAYKDRSLRIVSLGCLKPIQGLPSDLLPLERADMFVLILAPLPLIKLCSFD